MVARSTSDAREKMTAAVMFVTSCASGAVSAYAKTSDENVGLNATVSRAPVPPAMSCRVDTRVAVSGERRRTRTRYEFQMPGAAALMFHRISVAPTGRDTANEDSSPRYWSSRRRPAGARTAAPGADAGG